LSVEIVVTGGRGFIGSHVARYAEQAGHTVRFFDKREGNDIMGDLSALSGADAVIHLAGVLGTMELFETVAHAAEINVVGSARIAEWCAKHGVQYTGILVPDVFPSIYCATKAGAKRITDALHDNGRLRVSHVIAYNAFGPGQAYGPGHPRKFGPTFSVAALNNQPIPIWGDGTALIDPVPVEVVARMLVDATGFGNNEVFDGGVGRAVSVNEVADEVLAITGSTGGVEHELMRIGEAPTNVAATGLGWELLDWNPAEYGAIWRDYLRVTVNSYRGVPFDGEFSSGLK
jgi:UDP-glucose 4-epimerase